MKLVLAALLVIGSSSAFAKSKGKNDSRMPTSAGEVVTMDLDMEKCMAKAGDWGTRMGASEMHLVDQGKTVGVVTYTKGANKCEFKLVGDETK